MPLVVQSGPNATTPETLGRMLRDRVPFTSRGVFRSEVPAPGDLNDRFLGMLLSPRYVTSVRTAADYVVWSGTTPVGWHIHPAEGWLVPEGYRVNLGRTVWDHRRMTENALRATRVTLIGPWGPWRGQGHYAHPVCSARPALSGSRWSCTLAAGHDPAWHEAWYYRDDDDQPAYAWNADGAVWEQGRGLTRPAGRPGAGRPGDAGWVWQGAPRAPSDPGSRECSEQHIGWTCTVMRGHAGWHEAWHYDQDSTEPGLAWSPDYSDEWSPR